VSEQLRRAAIASPLRTPVGIFGGALRDVQAGISDPVYRLTSIVMSDSVF
jgi:hypothetical protein